MSNNPFSTKYFIPGAIDYQCDSQTSIKFYADCFIKNGKRGQVIGPHGSGKSTFLLSLQRQFQQDGWQTKLIVLHNSNNRFCWSITAPREAIILIDGYEQLSFLSRFLIFLQCRWNRWGLVVSSHFNAGFPVLLETKLSCIQAFNLAKQLLINSDCNPDLITLPQIQQLYDKHQGNLREIFFDLYDWFETL